MRRVRFLLDLARRLCLIIAEYTVYVWVRPSLQVAARLVVWWEGIAGNKATRRACRRSGAISAALGFNEKIL
jgi:hypothetical protein